MTVRKEICAAHRHREQVPLDWHHVWPLSEGGPDEDWNIVVVCPNAHREIHEYLRLLAKGPVNWRKKRFFGKKVRNIAELGFRLMNEG